MRLTVRTNLAMRALMFCAVNENRTVRKAEIAEACNSSENHLGVVINMLGQTGFIETTRGRNGGVRLKVDPQVLSVGQVFRVFESNVPFAECFAGSENHCPLTASCRLRGKLSIALEAFYIALDDVTLADLVEDNTGLHSLLQLETA
ncbi:BadM/Rrf2 family transcriptional regulator [Aliiruegeria haliotis]|uniref:BadM/Rrf2 family transcriptional regulator n=1 Tax=Aliiruegeria haliotis TaxID=1280846 RepID=A0A2T0RW58_9RHOB|nr:Rrf2 family transcriptional regulator [Aliiruegeria haliotis]PRY25388.1 BadM/Rrf2 family transcriptional regulator [Aliiruegeria haliotis]